MRKTTFFKMMLLAIIMMASGSVWGQAILPFSYDDGKPATNVTGLTQTGLGSDYTASPKMKFDTAGDNLILFFTGSPGTLSFKIKWNQSTAATRFPGDFILQESADGSTYTTVQLYNTTNGTALTNGTVVTETFTTLLSTTRYLKWIYTTRNNGNIALGAISLAASSLPSSPTLTAASSATVDAPYDVTFTDDAAWRAAITEITVGGASLDVSAYNTTVAGKISFTPSASALLQSAGTKSIVVKATGYTDAIVSQTIGAGVATALTIKTQPTAPITNGGTLATQPEVEVKDQYGNATAGTVAATKGDAGSWTLGGTTSVATNSGVSSYTNLTASSTAAVTGAFITFTLGSLSVSSTTLILQLLRLR